MRMIALLLISAAGLQAQDLRIVAGRTVDLQPVHAWFDGGRAGERPLKHWKRVQVTEIKKQIASADDCLVVVEQSGVTNEVLLLHCEKEVREPLASLAEIDSQIAALRTELAAGRGPVQENSIAARRMNAGRAADEAAARKRLSDLQMQREQAWRNARDAKGRFILAMSMAGQKYGGLEVWDCGIKQ